MTRFSMTIPPAYWAEVGGIFVWVEPLDDPLLRQDLYQVDVHRDQHGHAWVEVQGVEDRPGHRRSGANGGVRVQSTPPTEGDLP
jgi:hypothetical protein